MFKDRVKAARKELKWSQQDLADRMGISRSTIRDIETGTNKGGNLKLILKLCEVTGKPSTYFLEGENTPVLEPFEALEAILKDVAASPFVDDEGNITLEGLKNDVYKAVKLTLKKLKDEQNKINR